jgi:hypothetical protein
VNKSKKDDNNYVWGISLEIIKKRIELNQNIGKFYDQGTVDRNGKVENNYKKI